MFVDLNVLGLDAKPAAIRHRVARVDTEVHQYLMQLCRISTDIPQIRDNRESDLDIFGQSIGEDFYDLFDQMGRLQCDVFAFDAAREREYLFDHLAASYGVRVKDVEKSPAALIVKAHLQQLNSSENR